MYPDGFTTHIEVEQISGRLCGAFRPGHFRGVATVVAKLFHIVQPGRAYFGQKDFQQTLIVRRMAEDLDMDPELVVCPTVREEDGLAMSSRNAYLDPGERMAATVLYKALSSGVDLAASGAATATQIRDNMHRIITSEPLVSELQYAGVYDPETLDPLDHLASTNLLAVALKIGSTRLIDNMLVERPSRD
jgi:pantoate--beta-alanine ligase